MEGSKRMSWAIRAVYQERGITDQGAIAGEVCQNSFTCM